MVIKTRQQSATRFRRQAIMQRQCISLVFQQHAGMPGGQRRKGARHGFAQRQRQGAQHAIGAAQFRAMAANGRALQRREQCINHRQRTPTDERQRTIQPRRQQAQSGFQAVGHDHGIGRAGQIKQGAVNVQKQGRVGIYRRRHCENMSRFKNGKSIARRTHSVAC